MGYPVSYRRNATNSRQNLVRSFLRDESGFLRFPDGRQTWKPRPTPYGPTRPFRLPGFTPEVLPDPDPGAAPDYRRRFPLRQLPSLPLRFLDIALQLFPGGDFAMPAGGAFGGQVCGPMGWPGPPYRQSYKYFYANTVSNTNTCGLASQSYAGSAQVPNPLTRTVYGVWGPNEGLLPLQRWYNDAKWTNASANPQLTPLRYYPQPVPSPWLAHLPLGAYDPVPIAPPLWSVPNEVPANGPQSNTATSTFNRPVPDTSPDRGQTGHPDIRPPPREVERKLDGAVGVAFRLLGQAASWSSIVDALWRSLPMRYRRGRHTLADKLDDIYRHYDEIDFHRAVRNLVTYWLLYRAAGWAYGTAYRDLVRRLGPNAGPRLYRALVQAGAI